MLISQYFGKKMYSKLVPNLSHIKHSFNPRSLSYLFFLKNISHLILFYIILQYFVFRFSLFFKCFFFLLKLKKNIPKDIHNNPIDSGIYLFAIFKLFTCFVFV